MRERPIIMSGESIRAILDGRKSMTRRVIDPRKYNIGGWDMPVSKYDIEAGYPVYQDNNGDFHSVVDRCLYGKVSDRLWIRENYTYHDKNNKYLGVIKFKADTKDIDSYKWKSPMYMCKSDSRIILEITNIRVEQLHDITEEDAIREGFYAMDNFMEAWRNLNAKRGYPWESNPWVWVISFKVMK